MAIILLDAIFRIPIYNTIFAMAQREVCQYKGIDPPLTDCYFLFLFK